jgi:hypothetical protein
MSRFILLCSCIVFCNLINAQPYQITTIKEDLGNGLKPSEIHYYDKDSILVKKEYFGMEDLRIAKTDTISVTNPITGEVTLKIVRAEGNDLSSIGETGYFFYNQKKLELIVQERISVIDQTGTKSKRSDSFYVTYLKDGRSYSVSAANPDDPFKSGYTILVDKMGNEQKMPQGYKYTLDALGRLKTKAYKLSKWKYSYPKAGISRMQVSRKGAAPTAYIKYYNKRNQIIKEMIEEGVPKKVSLLKEYIYENNRLVKMVYYNEDGAKEITLYEHGLVE